MTTDIARHFVFVDLENVPNVDLGMVEGRPVHVTVLIGKNQRKFELALVRQIQRLGGRVELVEVGASGRNALDLTLACYLGQAVQRMPDADFSIISKDKDFDAMIGHLLGKGIKVGRHESLAALPFVAPKRKATIAPFPPQPKPAAPARGPAPVKPASPAKRLPADRSAQIIVRLSDPTTRNRPATKTRLLAHLATALGKESSAAKVQDILDELIQRGALTIAGNGRVEYASAE